MNRWWHRWLAAWVLAGAFALPVQAADVPDVKIQAVLSGVAARSTDSSDGVAAETIWLKGDRVRVDFDAGQGRRGRILRDGHGHAWLFMSTSDRALPARNVKIGAVTRLDPAKPCWELGFACEKVGDRIIAGRLAHGWRYRHAEQSGPGGTDSGVFWIDAQYGLLLAFNGKELGEHARRMETTALDFQAIPAATFEAPEGIRQEIDNADRRADALRGYSH